MTENYIWNCYIDLYGEEIFLVKETAKTAIEARRKAKRDILSAIKTKGIKVSVDR